MWAKLLLILLTKACLAMAEEDGEKNVDLTGRTKACDVLIAIDEPLWERHDRNMTQLTDLAKAHVHVS